MTKLIGGSGKITYTFINQDVFVMKPNLNSKDVQNQIRDEAMLKEYIKRATELSKVPIPKSKDEEEKQELKQKQEIIKKNIIFLETQKKYYGKNAIPRDVYSTVDPLKGMPPLITKELSSSLKEDKTESERPPVPTRLSKKSFQQKIKHFWYRDWNDLGAPYQKGTRNIEIRFIRFVDILLDDIKADPGGTIIHCSAGVGRTGTLFVILKICLEKGKNLTDLLDTRTKITQDEINKAIVYARIRRILLVQTIIQYEFLLELFNVTNPKKISEAELLNFGEKEILLLNQPKYSSSGSPPPLIDKKTFKQHALKCMNQNRYGDILPYDNTIVQIIGSKSPGYDDPLSADIGEIDCNNYINASYLNTSIQKCNNGIEKSLCNDTVHLFYNSVVIAAQGPIGKNFIEEMKKQGVINIETISKFLKMLEANKIKRVIMLTNLIEEKDGKPKNKCDDYTSGDLTLTKIESDNLNNAFFGCFTEYTLKYDDIGGLKLQDGVQMETYENLPGPALPPENPIYDVLDPNQESDSNV